MLALVVRPHRFEHQAAHGQHAPAVERVVQPLFDDTQLDPLVAQLPIVGQREAAGSSRHGASNPRSSAGIRPGGLRLLGPRPLRGFRGPTASRPGVLRWPNREAPRRFPRPVAHARRGAARHRLATRPGGETPGGQRCRRPASVAAAGERDSWLRASRGPCASALAPARAPIRRAGRRAPGRLLNPRGSGATARAAERRVG